MSNSPFSREIFHAWKQNHQNEFTQEDVDDNPGYLVFIWIPNQPEGQEILARSILCSKIMPENEKELALTIFMERIFKDFYWDLLKKKKTKMPFNHRCQICKERLLMDETVAYSCSRYDCTEIIHLTCSLPFLEKSGTIRRACLCGFSIPNTFKLEEKSWILYRD